MNAADLDQDGLNDIVAANIDSQEFSVLLGKDIGNVASHVGFFPGADSVAVGDVDRDGDLDLVFPGRRRGFGVLVNEVVR